MSATYPDPADPAGYDVDVAGDIYPDGRAASGPRLVTNEMLHRLQADVLPDALAASGFRPYGADASDWIQGAISQDIANAKTPLVTMVVNRDPRLNPALTQVRNTVTQADDDYDMTIAVQGYLANGAPVSLVVGVTDLTVELLESGT